MGPKDCAKGVHNFFELFHSHIALSSFTIINVCFKLIEAVVNLLVLSEKLQLLPKSWHFLRQYGKDVLLFCRYCLVD